MSNKKSVEAVYTICPVLVASHVAVEKGWLQTELKKVGASLKYLWSLPHEEWLAHFTHNREDFFRDGGNIPAIWARSEGRKTKLIGLTFSGDDGQILVRRDSDIFRIQELKGLKIGLFKRLNGDRVDFWRATAEKGILNALRINGLKRSDVQIVDLKVEESYPTTLPANSPAELWWSKRTDFEKTPGIYDTEVKALLDKKVDAIYVNHGRSTIFQPSGNVKAIENLALRPDWTLQVANTPYSITVSADLADKHPEIAIAYLKSVIKAGRWIREHHEETAAIFTKVISPWAGTALAAQVATYDFVPNLSKQNLAGIEVQKQFLLENGYIKNDFDVQEWADPSYLEEALGGKSRVNLGW